METTTIYRFDPASYLKQLKHCFLDTAKQVACALSNDLEVPELKKLCKHLNCSCVNVVQRVCEELKI